MTVASRIGLMDHGKLAQVATPPVIYENPNSRFVADFIGDVNLIEGKAGEPVANGDEPAFTFVRDADNVRFTGQLGPESGELREGDRCWLAVRPAKIAITRSKPENATNLIAGKVEDIGYYGNVSNYHVRLPDGTMIKAQEANRRRIANREINWEDEVWLSWTPGAAVILAR